MRLAEQNMPSHLLYNQMGHANSKVTEKYYITVSKYETEIIKDKIEGIWREKSIASLELSMLFAFLW